MKDLYEIVILGEPSSSVLLELENSISKQLNNFDFHLNQEVKWSVKPHIIKPNGDKAMAAIYWGGANASSVLLTTLLEDAIPVLPVVSGLDKIKDEIPSALQCLNCIPVHEGYERIAATILECIGLLPQQRRAFLSYRREESSMIALQLYERLAAKHIDVFLDTHKIAYSEEFQSRLWHELSDCDVLIMLDTENYFSSRWTTAEFARAQAKNIPILRVAWPDVEQDKRTGTATNLQLASDDFKKKDSLLKPETLNRIDQSFERIRSKGYAVRNILLKSTLRSSVEQVSGSVVGYGLKNSMFVELANGKKITLFPTLGIPSSHSAYEALKVVKKMNGYNEDVAIVYDPIGIHNKYQEHIDWLNEQITVTRWIKSHMASWCFADWEEKI